MSRERPKKSTFLELYMNGQVLPEEIDDYVDKWHDDSGNQPIYEFLGVSKQEYFLWLRDPDVLPHIIRARRNNKPLSEVIGAAMDDMLIAARSDNATKIKRIKQWLAKEGKTD